MTTRTIYVFDAADVVVLHADGTPPRNGDLLAGAINGDAFAWEGPDDVSIDLPAATVAITFEDSDGFLTDNPYDGANVADQSLSAPLTIGGVSYTPNDTTVRWQSPPPVVVEPRYTVTLYDLDGNLYTMVGVTITVGYTSTIAGVMFDGPVPAPGTTLYYLQGASSYSGSGISVEIPPESVACFLAGTLIETPAGARPIENLSRGDLVTTLESGPRPIRWIGGAVVPGLGKLAPVRIAAGRLGNRRPLFLSPNHRILMRSPVAELCFGSPEALVAAKHLVDGRAVVRMPLPQAHYLHIALDEHEMLFAEGIACESLATGPMAVTGLSAAALAELRAVFPEYFRRTAGTRHRVLNRDESLLLLADAH